MKRALAVPLAAAVAATSVTPVALGRTRPSRIAILPSIVRGGADAIDPLDVVEAIAPTLALRVQLDPVTSSELLAGTAEPVLSTAERCGSDLECISERARPSGIDLALRVVVNYAIDPPVLSLHLVDTASATIVREAFGGASRSTIGAEIARLSRELFDEAGYPEGARVRIDVSPPDAQISLDGEPDRTAGVFVVLPGSHRVEAQREGYLPAAQVFEAKRGEEMRIAVGMLEVKTSLAASPWLWTGIAAGVAVAAAVVAIVVIDPFRPGSICFGSAGAPCDPAR